MADSTVRCWGYNGWGQLGDGSGSHRTSPAVVLGVANVEQVAAGSLHTCAMTTSGEVWCWGAAFAGQTGGWLVSSPQPLPVAGIADAASIDAGEDHTCAVHTNGRVSCWGQNTTGQLGDGTTQTRAEPGFVVDLDDVVQVDANWMHTCAVTATETVHCWGSNEGGWIGDGVFEGFRVSPVDADLGS